MVNQTLTTECEACQAKISSRSQTCVSCGHPTPFRALTVISRRRVFAITFTALTTFAVFMSFVTKFEPAPVCDIFICGTVAIGYWIGYRVALADYAS